MRKQRSATEPGDGLSHGPKRPRVILIEDNRLTAWMIERTLSPAFEVHCCATLEKAETELARTGAEIVICGSPVADDRPDEVRRLAQGAGRRVVALVSDPDSVLSGQVEVLEKPFDLSRLTVLLTDRPSDASVATTAAARSGLRSLADRLAERLEREICPICIHRTADGGCTQPNRSSCPVFEWAAQLAEVVDGIRSDRLGDYMDQIAAIICPGCKQQPDGRCAARDHLDCPLDLYLGLIVPIIEGELARTQRESQQSTGKEADREHGA